MEKGGYRPQLDVLRAIAIGLVLIEHFSGPTGIREHFPIGPGALGVHLFFVLSGFLISGNFLRRLDRHPPGQVLKHFYLTRAARLMPAYYLTLLVTFLFGVSEVHDYILWHVLYASNYLVSVGGPITVFWTLGVEEQFYLLLPFLILMCRRNAILVACLFIGFGFLSRVLCLETPVPFWSFDDTILGKFEILGSGVLIGALIHNGHQFSNSWFMRVAIVCFIVETILWHFWRDSVVQYLSFSLIMGVFFAWVVLLAHCGRPGILAWFGRYAFIRFVGKISYGIYLMHTFFVKIFQSDWFLSHFGAVPLPVQGAVCIVLSFCVPAASWIFMEAPIIRLKDRWWNRRHLPGVVSLLRIRRV